jgi:hypothetical protein
MRKGKDPDPESVPLTNGSGSGRPKRCGSSGSGSKKIAFELLCAEEKGYNEWQERNTIGKGGVELYLHPELHKPLKQLFILRGVGGFLHSHYIKVPVRLLYRTSMRLAGTCGIEVGGLIKITNLLNLDTDPGGQKTYGSGTHHSSKIEVREAQNVRIRHTTIKEKDWWDRQPLGSLILWPVYCKPVSGSVIDFIFLDLSNMYTFYTDSDP